jgi:TRAP-type mannitol/chloroaromatic compound transport system permease small subunit
MTTADSTTGSTGGQSPESDEGTPARSSRPGAGAVLLRIFAQGIVAAALLFVFSNYLVFWRGWPGFTALFVHYGLFGFEQSALVPGGLMLAWTQVAIWVAVLAGVVAMVVRTPGRSLIDDSDRLGALAAFIVRAAFWAVFLVGLGDIVISFLRVEGMLASWIGAPLTQRLGLANFRGIYVHYPLIGLSLVIAYFSRSLGFSWLALLVVVAEFQIVLSRFVFSYEQAFMGDLVRFWYAALFIFASAYTLISEGHVRVDVFYTNFSDRGKARANAIGSLLLGAPLCWVILLQGMGSRTNIINSPILSYEISQSGFGMYVKYLMAGFLAVFALSMLIQFMGYFLRNVAVLRGDARFDDVMAVPTE